jgi:hypothetical protein
MKTEQPWDWPPPRRRWDKPAGALFPDDRERERQRSAHRTVNPSPPKIATVLYHAQRPRRRVSMIRLIGDTVALAALLVFATWLLVLLLAGAANNSPIPPGALLPGTLS